MARLQASKTGRQSRSGGVSRRGDAGDRLAHAHLCRAAL